jgi:hypothetical protein
MRQRDIPPTALVEALNGGPGSPREDVRKAAEDFDTSERTVYRRINQYGIAQICRWTLPDDGEKEAA